MMVADDSITAASDMDDQQLHQLMINDIQFGNSCQSHDDWIEYLHPCLQVLGWIGIYIGPTNRRQSLHFWITLGLLILVLFGFEVLLLVASWSSLPFLVLNLGHAVAITLILMNFVCLNRLVNSVHIAVQL
jgi:hypothetical protein